MTVLTNIKTVLEADGTLTAIATGGIYDYDEIGRTGINRTSAPAAFDSNELIKPCILIKLRSDIPDGALMDDALQYVTSRQIYEIWLYQDTGFDSIDAMIARVFVLLHGVQIAGTFQVHWLGDATPFRDDEIDANVNRSDYMATVKRST
jgi:hypothetical protein